MVVRDLGGEVSVKEGMNRVGIYKMFGEMGFKTGVEIGVWHGVNAWEMFNVIPGLKLYCVDPYKIDGYLGRVPYSTNGLDRAKRRSHERLKGFNVEFLEMTSEEAATKVPDNSIDFVYIDGNHGYDAVMLDVILWNRKVKKGGVISGHDYFRSQSRDVGISLAVMHYTRQHNIRYFITDKMAERPNRAATPSWYWIKEYWIYPW